MTEALHYLLIDDQQTGPYTLSQVKEMWMTGTVSSETLFWKEGQAEWEPLMKMASLLDPPPPLVPPVPPSYLPQSFSPSTNPQPLPTRIADTPPETSGLAITSLTLGIMGLFSGVTAIPAIICGHMSLGRIKRSAGSLTGRGMAIAGMIMGYIVVAIFGAIMAIAILASIALPFFSSVQDRGAATKCLSNAKMIALGCKIYATDHEGNYPQNLDQLIPDYLPDNHAFACPISKDATSIGYEYYGGKDTDPPDKILLRSKATTRDHKRVVVYSDGSGLLKSD